MKTNALKGSFVRGALLGGLLGVFFIFIIGTGETPGRK